jgi:hypothetical protein
MCFKIRFFFAQNGVDVNMRTHEKKTSSKLLYASSMQNKTRENLQHFSFVLFCIEETYKSLEEVFSHVFTH